MRMGSGNTLHELCPRVILLPGVPGYTVIATGYMLLLSPT